MSATLRSPDPARECSSMFLTIESARLPCCTTLSRLPASSSINSAVCSSSCGAEPIASFSSSMSSIDSAAKLLTKFSGFLISCAMPAVSWPSEASFSVWISRSCAALSSSRDFASSRVRASTSSNRRAFWMASTDWAAKVWSRSIVELGNRPGSLRRTTSAPTTRPGRRSGTTRSAAIACAQDEVSYRRGGLGHEVRHLHGLAALGGGADVGFAKPNTACLPISAIIASLMP